MTEVHLLFKKPKGTGTPPVHLVFGESDGPPPFVGTGTGVLAFTGAGVAAHGIASMGAGVLAFFGAGTAEHTSSGVEADGAGVLAFAGAGAAAHGVAGQGAGVLAFAGAGAGAAAHGIAGAGAGALGFVGACTAQHLRYEVRGEVRLGGVLVNRRVRCYKRATGELTGQADTVAGKYRVHAGFDDAEVYATAIHLDEAATDWLPPTANRLVPVLADDTA